MKRTSYRIELPEVQAVEQQRWRSGKGLFAIAMFSTRADRIALACLAGQLALLVRMMVGELWVEAGICAIVISATLQFFLDREAIAGRAAGAGFDRPGRALRDQV